ncbi:hypothetical protein [Microbispora amethystogenes]|uniref:Uncharacterized protein n=1 Tax=Microbispora amethystogenes TaxID=1427754 RepID=A0ABQ4FPV9_9ACTN|nr:hypothetical protein [Microbispora amethystogenes]GIH36834.1 hypothetical protein Mam01_69980 [Microbispora amethystogenes]
MFTFALIVSLACLAVPLSIYLRMVFTRRRTVAQIHAAMSEHRRTCSGHPDGWHVEQDTEATS